MTLNGTTRGSITKIEPKDVANYDYLTRHYYMVLSGVNILAFRFWNEVGGSTTVSDTSIELIRVQ